MVHAVKHCKSNILSSSCMESSPAERAPEIDAPWTRLLADKSNMRHWAGCSEAHSLVGLVADRRHTRHLDDLAIRRAACSANRQRRQSGAFRLAYILSRAVGTAAGRQFAGCCRSPRKSLTNCLQVAACQLRHRMDSLTSKDRRFTALRGRLASRTVCQVCSCQEVLLRGDQRVGEGLAETRPDVQECAVPASAWQVSLQPRARSARFALRCTGGHAAPLHVNGTSCKRTWACWHLAAGLRQVSGCCADQCQWVPMVLSKQRNPVT